ncbi:hypothetical protein MMC13_002201 [Lambiella insularis]|nr:hypothetical protein [Lambiella insularis]
MPALQRWKEPGGGDLGMCVERILKETPFPEQQQNLPTLELIDAALNDIAKRSRFSGPDIRVRKSENGPYNVDQKLSSIYHRLKPYEAKWFTRMLLKDYSPVDLPQGLILRCFHPLLPNIMKIHDSIGAAVAFLRQPNLMRASNTLLSAEDANSQSRQALTRLLPKCGVKIGRPYFYKAWSVNETLRLAHGRKMSLERKYDGEYCQIHVDLEKPGNEIQIFSKSGKDSTKDKRGVHSTIRECLRIGYDDCHIKHHCILEGELLIYSDRTNKILDFHKVRKHVDRSGVIIGANEDSQPHPWEHLMIMFFDVMMIDEEPVLHDIYRRRKDKLMRLITIIPGRAELAKCQDIDFSRSSAPHELMEALAIGFAKRWEGYVLKPVEEPYVDIKPWSRGSYHSCWIKLKKDYIPGLGDTAELAVVGAGYDTKLAAKLRSNLPWNVFHIGALLNKNEVLNFGAPPKFKVLDAFNTMITTKDMERLCQIGKFSAEKIGRPPVHAMLDKVQKDHHFHDMDVVFKEPVVFEVKGSGFDKPSNADYYALRFPRLVKIHWDRTIRETVSFDELQKMAHQAMTAPEGDLHAEIASWKARVEASERGKKGKKSRWEESQEMEAESDVDNIAPVFLADSSPLPETKASSKTTFIRMDTTEMLPNEKRLESGRVVSSPATSATESASSSFIQIETTKKLVTERCRDSGSVVPRPVSSHSTATTASASTLPSPPSSSPPQNAVITTTCETHTRSIGKKTTWYQDSPCRSPVSKLPRRDKAPYPPISSPPRPTRTAVPKEHLEAKGKKRPWDGDSDLSPPVLKARRTMPNSQMIPYTTHERTALAEVINSAQPQPRPAAKITTTKPPTAAPGPSSFALVPKLPAHIPPPRTPRHRPTTTSELSPSPLSTSRASSPTSSPQSPLPTPFPSPPTPYPFPPLSSHLTLLSPCIAHMPYLTQTLLPPLSAHIVNPPAGPLLPAALRCAHDVPGGGGGGGGGGEGGEEGRGEWFVGRVRGAGRGRARVEWRWGGVSWFD